MTAFLVVLAAAALAGLFVWSYMNDVRRRQALQSYCASMGWSYLAEDDSWTVRWNGSPFGVGDRRHAKNVLSGTDRGLPFVAMDYQYDTESTDSRGGRDRTTHRYSVVALALPTILPRLEVTPESLVQRAAAAVGLGGDIQLESEDFNRRFVVHARQPKFASDVLNPRTMEALLGAPPLAWRIEMADLVSWSAGSLRPLDVLARLQTLHHVVDGIPSFVWHDNGLPDPSASVAEQPAAAPAPAPDAPVRAPVVPPPTLVAPAPAPVVPTATVDPAPVAAPPAGSGSVDHGAVFSPHDAAPATTPAPAAEGGSA